ncbi:pirin family protein [Gordonia sp. ABSL1-1]|uniref:pirin family protein n=1 Tax=Gordonia sp. ABSL1-1 TaxID=3053923 RepID=UPI0025739D8A|nr:pirin family protein [Gordonia sp. ABSL1-1]MDL9936661.1 pirin family protein [Gordonia sp. ABSL1-1]
MSNLDPAPDEIECRSSTDRVMVDRLTPRAVPLGGPRAMTVQRTLPQRRRSLIGAWCFADHYGPDDVSATGGMDVPPHPHTGLATVSWLFAGEIEHRDTMGTHALVRPGELNLMTAGHGVAHTEVSTADTTVLHGVQLWVALPAAAADVAPAFDHYRPEPVRVGPVTARVFLGELFDSRSPVRTHTPLLGAELLIEAGATAELTVDPTYEHGVLVDAGTIAVTGSDTVLDPADLGYLGTGTDRITLVNTAPTQARVVLLGGEPLGEEIIMWWNFLGRSHDEIAQSRADWMAHSDRFGQVHGYQGPVQHLPAPALPTVHLRPRRNDPS